MNTEPPLGYVSFVGRQLSTLRADAAGVVGGAVDPERLYSPVLVEVAARWRWLELGRVLLRRTDLPERWLGRAFARQVRRWRAEPVQAEEMVLDVWLEQWRPGDLVDPALADPDWGRPALGGAWLDESERPGAPARSSAAVRLAPWLFQADHRGADAAARDAAAREAWLEAGLAWLHAHHAAWRRRVVTEASLAVGFVLVVIGWLRNLGSI